MEIKDHADGNLSPPLLLVKEISHTLDDMRPQPDRVGSLPIHQHIHVSVQNSGFIVDQLGEEMRHTALRRMQDKTLEIY